MGHKFPFMFQAAGLQLYYKITLGFKFYSRFLEISDMRIFLVSLGLACGHLLGNFGVVGNSMKTSLFLV